MNNKHIDFRKIFISAGLLALVIVYLLLWSQMIFDNALRTGSDFIAFYSAGRVAQQEGFSSVYDIQH